MPGQDHGLQQHVGPLAFERVVDRLADEARLAFPELRKLVDVRGEHVVAKYAIEIFDEMIGVLRAEQRERAAIDLDDANPRGALDDARRVFGEKRAQVGDARGAPSFELLAR